MNRRSTFLIAVIVVLVYFSIIVFMLRPLQSGRSYYGNNIGISHLGFREIRVSWCKDLRLRSPPSSHVVALVSYPGSGNTWLRYLLQQVTGIVTGSIYMDYGLRMHGFPAENVTDGSVLVVKTHEAPPVELNKFKSAILLIRNPRDAILADFNRLHKGHIGTAPKSAFKKKSHEPNKSDWTSYVFNQLSVWESLHRQWITKFLGPIHVVFYELLVRDTRNTLLGILNFLNHTVSEEDMNCAVAKREGIYKRKKKYKDFEPFSPEMYSAIYTVRQRVLQLVTEYKDKHKNITLVVVQVDEGTLNYLKILITEMSNKENLQML